MKVIRNRIWTELTQSKHNIAFIAKYTKRQRTILRYFNILILTFSSAGVMGWGIWEQMPLMACIVIALMSLLKLLQPELIMNEKQFGSLDKIGEFYSNYYNNMEELWFDYESNRISEEDAKSLFFNLKSGEIEINPLVIETIRSKPQSIIKKCKEETDNYFNQVFNV